MGAFPPPPPPRVTPMAEPVRPRGDPPEEAPFSLAQIMHLMRVEFGRAQRYRYPLSCLLIAVDRLGHLRDLYGYEAKEEILAEVVSLLEAQSRGCDFLGRLMDDRLLAVVPHTGAEGARVLGERLVAGARRLRFVSDDRELGVTLSVGASTTERGEPLFFDSLLAAAEGALEEASAAGGDRLSMRDAGAPAG